MTVKISITAADLALATKLTAEIAHLDARITGAEIALMSGTYATVDIRSEGRMTALITTDPDEIEAINRLVLNLLQDQRLALLYRLRDLGIEVVA